MMIWRRMRVGYQDKIIIIREMSFPNSLPWGTSKIYTCRPQVKPKEATEAYCVHTVWIRVRACYCTSWSFQGRVPKRITCVRQQSPGCVRELPENSWPRASCVHGEYIPSLAARIPWYSQTTHSEYEGNILLHNKHIYLCKYLN